MYKPFLLTLSPKNSPKTNTQPLNAITNICTVSNDPVKTNPLPTKKQSIKHSNPTCYPPKQLFSNAPKSARPPAPLHNFKPTSNAPLQGVAYLKIVLLVDRGAAATKTKPSTLDKYHCLKAMTMAFPKALANSYC